MVLKKVNSFILCLGLLGSLAGQAVTGVGSISSSKNRVVCSKNKKIKDVKKPKISASQKSQKKSPLKEDLQKFFSEYWEWLLLLAFLVGAASFGYKMKKYLEKCKKIAENKEKRINPKADLKKEERSKIKSEEPDLDLKTKKVVGLDNHETVDVDVLKDDVIKSEVKVESQAEDKSTNEEDFSPLFYALDRYWVLYIISKIYGKDSKTYEEVENFFNNTSPESFSKLKIFIRAICRANLVFSFIFAVSDIIIFIVKGGFNDGKDGKSWLTTLDLFSLIISPFSPTFGKVLSLAYGIAVGCKNAESTAGKVAFSTFASLGGFVFGCGFPIFLKEDK